MGPDGGGDTPLEGINPLQGEYWWLPVAISGLALLISFLVPTVNIFLSRRAARRQVVRDALSSLLTPEVVRARVVLARVGRNEHEFRHPSYIDGTEDQRIASNKEIDDFTNEVRGASFTVMWAIQALVPTLRPYVEQQIEVSWERPWLSMRRSLGVPEAETVLRHVELMSSELGLALDFWGVMFTWHTSGKMTNEALSALSVMLGFEDRKLVELELPPTEVEIEAQREAEIREELGRSRSFGEQRKAAKAEQTAATAEWEATKAKWKPKIKPPSELRTDEGRPRHDF